MRNSPLFLLTCLLTACFSDPSENLGTGIIGLLMIIGGWKLGMGPARNWWRILEKVGIGLVLLGALCLIA